MGEGEAGRQGGRRGEGEDNGKMAYRSKHTQQCTAAAKESGGPQGNQTRANDSAHIGPPKRMAEMRRLPLEDTESLIQPNNGSLHMFQSMYSSCDRKKAREDRREMRMKNST